MVDLEILAAYGSTKDRLREVLTASSADEPPKRGESSAEKRDRQKRNRQRERDFAFRQKITDMIQTRVIAGIDFSLKNHRPYAAMDLAWDSIVLSKINMPMLLYAQGKIDVQKAVSSLEKIPNGEDYISRDAKGKATGINLPKFVESEINLIRSMVNRRWAAQKNKYANLWPYYAYESRSTGLVGKLRADVMSQWADIMVDGFGIRDHDNQVMLEGLLYSHVVDFVRCSWECEKQIRVGASGKHESYITKEGIGWINPHPTRLFWDMSYPLISLNTDSGCEYAGFWDVIRYGEVMNNPHYFNRDQIGFGENMWGGSGFYRQYQDYFNQYNYTINVPSLDGTGQGSNTIDVAGMNDSKTFVGLYNSSLRDSAMFLTNYFHRLVPSEWGLGDYPHPVWVRFVLASDSVPIFAEFLPSSPGAVLSINENNSRAVNVSMAMDLLQWQQHLNNLLAHLMQLLQIEGFKAIGINTDALEKTEIDAIKKQLASRDWAADPLIFKYSFAKKIEQLGQSAIKAVGEVITVSEARQGQSINTIFDAITKLITLAERMQQMSAAESGQSEPREISATQTNVIANTTQTIYSSISDAIDSFREAKKRIIYESTVMCAKGEIRTPVKNRYTKATIASANLQSIDSEDEDTVYPAKRRTIIGSPKALVHQYIFSSRDGSERPVNTQAANTMTQLIGYTLAVPEIAKSLGREKLYSMFNEVFRLSGSGFDLNLELMEGEGDAFGENEMQVLKQTIEQYGQILQQMAQQTQKNAQDVAAQTQVNAEQQQAIDLTAQLAEQLRNLQVQVQEIMVQNQPAPKAPPEIPYRDAPASVQAQMERMNGYTPAPPAERAVKAASKTTSKA